MTPLGSKNRSKPAIKVHSTISLRKIGRYGPPGTNVREWISARIPVHWIQEIPMERTGGSPAVHCLDRSCQSRLIRRTKGRSTPSSKAFYTNYCINYVVSVGQAETCGSIHGPLVETYICRYRDLVGYVLNKLNDAKNIYLFKNKNNTLLNRFLPRQKRQNEAGHSIPPLPWAEEAAAAAAERQNEASHSPHSLPPFPGAEEAAAAAAERETAADHSSKDKLSVKDNYTGQNHQTSLAENESMQNSMRRIVGLCSQTRKNAPAKQSTCKSPTCSISAMSMFSFRQSQLDLANQATTTNQPPGPAAAGQTTDSAGDLAGGGEMDTTAVAPQTDGGEPSKIEETAAAAAIPGLVQPKTKNQKKNERRKRNRQATTPLFRKSLPIRNPTGGLLAWEEWRQMRVNKFQVNFRRFKTNPLPGIAGGSLHFRNITVHKVSIKVSNHSKIMFRKVYIYLRKMFRKVYIYLPKMFRENPTIKVSRQMQIMFRKAIVYSKHNTKMKRLQVLMADWCATELINDTENEKYPDHDKLIVYEYMWIDKTECPQGKRPRDMPSTERKGYGQILAKDQEAVDLAETAFRETSLFQNSETNAKMYPQMEKREHDTRACFMASMHYATYNAGFEDKGRYWKYLQQRKGWPSLQEGFEIEKTWIFPKNNPEAPTRVVHCMKLSKEWENTIKDLPKKWNDKNKKDDYILFTMAGDITMDLRQTGGEM